VQAVGNESGSRGVGLLHSRGRPRSSAWAAPRPPPASERRACRR